MAAFRLPDPEFWQGKKVLLTGHTGFKGSWALIWLNRLGAKVTGLALPPETNPSLFETTAGPEHCSHLIADIYDLEGLSDALGDQQFDLVLHMAAQPLVRRSMRQPVETFATNVMGTAHLLSVLESQKDLKAILAVTTDKVYEPQDPPVSHTENNALGGHDPYSASKAATEMVVASWRDTFWKDQGPRLASARGGNVIGGGDFSEDRLIPDLWRAQQKGDQLALRFPGATRPWQYVLDCLNGYFLYLEDLASEKDTPNALNIAPDLTDEPVTVGAIASEAIKVWGKGDWAHTDLNAPAENPALALNSDLAKKSLGWRSCFPALDAVHETIRWYRDFDEGKPALDLCHAALDQFTGKNDG